MNEVVRSVLWARSKQDSQRAKGAVRWLAMRESVRESDLVYAVDQARARVLVTQGQSAMPVPGLVPSSGVEYPWSARPTAVGAERGTLPDPPLQLESP